MKKGSEAEFVRSKLNNENESEIYDFLGLNKEKIIKEVEKINSKEKISEWKLKQKNQN